MPTDIREDAGASSSDSSWLTGRRGADAQLLRPGAHVARSASRVLPTLSPAGSGLTTKAMSGARREGEQVPPGADPASGGRGSRARLHGVATVLVADDDSDGRRAIRTLLSSEGYRVVEAADGEEAREVLSRAADGVGDMPDVVVLDFVMPGFSGIGVLRAMRRFEHPPPTIVMTGFPDPAVDTFALGLGALRVLRKPLDGDELLEAVHQAAGDAVDSA
jgi:CheY-like chemotaxis protein